MDRIKRRKRPWHSDRFGRWIFAGSALSVILSIGGCGPDRSAPAVKEVPVIPEVESPADPDDPFAPDSPSPEAGTGAAPSGAGESPLVGKLRAIVIPKVEFVDTPLKDAIDFLVTRSRELDPDPEGNGVNVILEDGLSASLLTLDVTNIPLAEALRITAELAGAQITIDEHAVVIGPRNGKGGGGAAVLSDPAAESALKKKLGELIVPSIEFRDTPLMDALSFLQDRSMDLDAGTPPDKRGINLMLDVPPESGIKVEDLKITLTLQKIPLGEALRYTADHAGLELGVEGDFVVISAPGKR